MVENTEIICVTHGRNDNSQFIKIMAVQMPRVYGNTSYSLKIKI